MSQSEMEAELERLRAENAQLKRKEKGGLSLKISEKGGLSLYGMGRFPVRSNSNKGTQSPTGRFGVSARQCPGLALVRNSLIGAAHLIPSARAVSYEP